MSSGLSREYRSPTYKLLPFFERSRDQWKEKCQKSNRKLKKTKERLQRVRARRDYWKALALQRVAESPPEPPAEPKNSRGERAARGRQRTRCR